MLKKEAPVSVRGVARAAVVMAMVAATLFGVPATEAFGSPGFYSPPQPLPSGANGDLIRTEPSALAISIPTPGGRLPGAATRLMYRSTDSKDRPIAVTGTYIRPAAAWTGPGPRPLIAFAPGTQGQGDQCAPSKLLNSVVSFTPPLGITFEYEVFAIYSLLSDGYGVVVTDYEGLGTPGTHTYVNRLAEGHALLDAAKAAQRLPDSGIPSNGPVGLWGYSQGGGAAASAAELAAQYAPSLDIKGTYAGAPPADLAATLAQIDGTSLVGAIAYTLNGLRYSEPDIGPIIDRETNAVGKKVLADAATQCGVESTLRYGLRRTSEWTASGKPLSEVLRGIPRAQEILAQNRIGRITPTGPVLVYSGTSDDLVPFGQAQQLAADWCGLGGSVEFRSEKLPPIFPGLGLGHIIPDLAGGAPAAKWMRERFSGAPLSSTCSAVNGR